MTMVISREKPVPCEADPLGLLAPINLAFRLEDGSDVPLGLNYQQLHKALGFLRCLAAHPSDVLIEGDLDPETIRVEVSKLTQFIKSYEEAVI